MPYEHDKRRKLSEADKQEIRELYQSPEWSQRKLAAKYDVSRRLIVFTLYPDRLAKSKADFAERQSDGRYYDRETHKQYMRRHRAHKHAVLTNKETLQ